MRYNISFENGIFKYLNYNLINLKQARNTIIWKKISINDNILYLEGVDNLWIPREKYFYFCKFEDKIIFAKTESFSGYDFNSLFGVIEKGKVIIFEIPLNNIEMQILHIYISFMEFQYEILTILGYSLTRKKIDKKIFSFTREGNLEIKNIIDLKEWLYLYNNSKSIFTDSYHGTIFSIIFRKPFITLKNKKRGGERFISLLKPLQLMNRLFETADCINKKYDLYDTINYSLPMKKLYKIKEKSYNWLKKKLKMFVK